MRSSPDSIYILDYEIQPRFYIHTWLWDQAQSLYTYLIMRSSPDSIYILDYEIQPRVYIHTWLWDPAQSLYTHLTLLCLLHTNCSAICKQCELCYLMLYLYMFVYCLYCHMYSGLSLYWLLITFEIDKTNLVVSKTLGTFLLFIEIKVYTCNKFDIICLSEVLTCS